MPPRHAPLPGSVPILHIAQREPYDALLPVRLKAAHRLSRPLAWKRAGRRSSERTGACPVTAMCDCRESSVSRDVTVVRVTHGTGFSSLGVESTKGTRQKARAWDSPSSANEFAKTDLVRQGGRRGTAAVPGGSVEAFYLHQGREKTEPGIRTLRRTSRDDLGFYRCGCAGQRRGAFSVAVLGGSLARGAGMPPPVPALVRTPGRHVGISARARLERTPGAGALWRESGCHPERYLGPVRPGRCRVRRPVALCDTAESDPMAGDIGQRVSHRRFLDGHPRDHRPRARGGHDAAARGQSETIRRE